MPLPDGRRRTDPECYRQSSSHAFILFAAICGADSSSSDLHFGNRISVFAPVSCLLAVQSAMTGFRPDSFFAASERSCAHSSGRVVFPFSCADACKSMLRLLFIGWHILKFSPQKVHPAVSTATIHDISVVCKQFRAFMQDFLRFDVAGRSLCALFCTPTLLADRAAKERVLLPI